MRKLMCIKRIACLIMAISLISVTGYTEPAQQVDTNVSTQLINAKSGILMEASTGEVLYEQNANERLQIASVTKVMTMLLIMEAIDSGKISLDDMVTTSEYAASMGGSQVFLEVGEQMSVNDMLKAIAVASGNDAAVAMAEFISGSEGAFVEKMNKRASELGCENTHFINCNGLDETPEHYSSARDVARISQELLKHTKIFDYTTIWMDSLRNGSFGLSNTNKLIRFYNGANGLKTGSTSTAKYCLSATALRDGMQLIAVIICAPSTKDRFSSASALLDYGFANYEVASDEDLNVAVPYVRVVGGVKEQIAPKVSGSGFVVKKGNRSKLETRFEMEESVSAPVEDGQKLGEIIYTIDGEEVTRRDVCAAERVDKINAVQIFLRCLADWLKL
ncbi:MAG: D-alanyl-D-alanine carboxypeptidase [Clostridiales bacterium]|nr:D-alanyl-D-alanine carboxypeptidase [Clostridiales bacterium]MBD9010611.1 D-alanyl-D-alanine carboxypeptidase [Clostridiales bacterium]